MSPQYGIRRYIALMTLLPLLMMASVLGAYFLIDRYKDFNNDIRLSGESLVRQLASSSDYGVFSRNRSFLEELTKSTIQERDVQAALVLGANSETLATAGSFKIPVERLLLLVNWRHPVFDDGDILVFYQPIYSTRISLEEMESSPVPEQTGAVIIEMSWQRTQQMKIKLLREAIVGTLLFLLLTLYSVYLASRRITDPIGKLSVAVDAIGAGLMDTRVTESTCIGELSNLVAGFNRMTSDLQQERDQLQSRIDEATEQLRNLAFYDTLTLLPNRRLMNDRLIQAMAISKRSGRYGALFFLDLDNFKPLNDQFGHAVGDLLLIEVARRIGRCLREMDTVARFGGDEFIVMLSELDEDRDESVRQAQIVAEKIRRELSLPYHLVYAKEGQPAVAVEHQCSSSIGVNLFLNHDVGLVEIMAGADAAMYQAKQEGRNTIRFFGCNNGK